VSSWAASKFNVYLILRLNLFRVLGPIFVANSVFSPTNDAIYERYCQQKNLNRR
jgi:hypothetical protein